MRTRAFAWPLAALLFAAPAAAQQPAPTVAVLDFEAFSVTLEDAGSVGRGVASMITTEFSTRPRVRMVERQEVESLLQKRQQAFSGRLSDAQALEIGQLLGAHYVVTGSVSLDRKNARLDIRILDVESGEVHRSAKKTGDRERLLSLVEEIADEFTKDLRLPERVAEVRVPVAASLAFSRGLDYERRGKREDARRMFERALELFPNHAEARTALGRVR